MKSTVFVVLEKSTFLMLAPKNSLIWSRNVFSTRYRDCKNMSISWSSFSDAFCVMFSLRSWKSFGRSSGSVWRPSVSLPVWCRLSPDRISWCVTPPDANKSAAKLFETLRGEKKMFLSWMLDILLYRFIAKSIFLSDRSEMVVIGFWVWKMGAMTQMMLSRRRKLMFLRAAMLKSLKVKLKWKWKSDHTNVAFYNLRWYWVCFA